MASSSPSGTSSAALSHRGSSRGSLRPPTSSGAASPAKSQFDGPSLLDPDLPTAPASASASASRSNSAASISNADSIPVETLVELLLRAKRSLSTMTLVLRANELTTQARSLHEAAIVLVAQAAFLQSGIAQQLRLLERVRRGLARTYDSGKREFGRIVKTLDAAGERLHRIMKLLRNRTVDPVFRPAGEEPKNLLDFVDENAVDTLTKALMDSIAELKAAETSFDGDLLRFDNDLRALKKLITSSPLLPSSPSHSSSHRPIPHLVHSLTEQSHLMAENLASLTRHFDLCVRAVRTSEGGADLALRKAAALQQSGVGAEDPVSISGVMGHHRGGSSRGGSSQSSSRASHRPPEEVEAMEPQERVEMLRVVVQDASEVDDVVADMHMSLRDMELDYSSAREQADLAASSHSRSLEALGALEEIGSRLASYVAAEREYTDRCDAEKLVVSDRLDEVENLGDFYEGYANAYDGLVLEFERRRGVDERIQAVLRKAVESVDRVVESDRAARADMQAEIGEFLPTDLWPAMHDPIRRWKVVPVTSTGGEDSPTTATATATAAAAAAAAFEELVSSAASVSPSASGVRQKQRQQQRQQQQQLKQLKQRRGGAAAAAPESSTTPLDRSVIQPNKERLGSVR